MIIEARALVLGDNVNTDLLHPPAFYSTDDGTAAVGAFAGLDIDRKALGPPPYVILAGKNFGCGSSRESTMRALKAAGLVAIAARSFAHIFRRTALNLGVPSLVLGKNPGPVPTGTPVALDTALWTLSLDGAKTQALEPFEELLLAAGGLEAHLAGKDWSWK